MNGPEMDRHIVLYDGECGLCDGFVQFVLRRDPDGRFAFAPLQGEFALRLLRQAGAPATPDAPLRTMFVMTAAGTLLSRSRAVLFVLRHLPRARVWATLGALLPRWAADRLYDFVAARRYRLFGRLDACRLPLPHERTRFL